MRFIDHITLSGKRSPSPKQDDMTGDDGASHPVPLDARTRPINGVSAAPGSTAGRSMKPGKDLANAGGSSADTVGFPLPPTKILKGKEVETEGGRKRKKAVVDASGLRYLCRVCSKSFKSPNAVNGHMHVHKNQPNQQTEEVASILLALGQRKSNPTEGSQMKSDHGTAVAEIGTPSKAAEEAQRKKIHKELDLNKKASENIENDDTDYGGDGGGC